MPTIASIVGSVKYTHLVSQCTNIICTNVGSIKYYNILYHIIIMYENTILDYFNLITHNIK